MKRLVKLLSDLFDQASRVSAFRSRFHGRPRRHHEDADTFADALAELFRVGYGTAPGTDRGTATGFARRSLHTTSRNHYGCRLHATCRLTVRHTASSDHRWLHSMLRGSVLVPTTTSRRCCTSHDHGDVYSYTVVGRRPGYDGQYVVTVPGDRWRLR